MAKPDPRAWFEDLLDRDGVVFRPPRRWLIREVLSLATVPPPQAPSAAPEARRDTVLVVPPFLTGDLPLAGFRQFLGRCGHDVHGWGLGVNIGPTARILAGLRRRAEDVAQRNGGKLTLIGVSLGGLLARDLAFDRPELVRQVITVASPFRLPTATNIAPLFRMVAHRYHPEFDFRRLGQPLPMPSLAIYTRTDGIVSWESCRSDDPLAINAEVEGSHMIICRYPQVLRLVAERLARGSPDDHSR